VQIVIAGGALILALAYLVGLFVCVFRPGWRMKVLGATLGVVALLFGVLMVVAVMSGM
jgi:hypothetical protein